MSDTMDDKLAVTMSMVADGMRREIEGRLLMGDRTALRVPVASTNAADFEVSGTFEVTDEKALALMALSGLFDADVRIEDMADVDDDGKPIYGWIVDPAAFPSFPSVGSKPPRKILVVPSVRRAWEIVERVSAARSSIR